MANRKTILSLLDKMAVNYTEKISVSRAVAKLRRAVEKKELPVGLNSAEKDALKEFGLIDEAPIKEKPAKKKPAKKKPAKEKPAKKKAAPKETTTRPDWMTVATKVVLKAKSVDEANGLAADEYLSQGGKQAANLEKAAKIRVSRTVKVLVAAGVITVDDDGKISK